MQMVNAMMTTTAGTNATTGTGSGAGNTAGSSSGADFGQLLVQVLGGPQAGTAGAGTLPDLAQLLAGLLASMPAGEESGAELTVNPDAWNKLLDRISEEPGLLEQLLGGEEMQEWLMQASMLLQSLQLMPEQSQAQLAVVEDPGEALGGQAGAVNLQQAQDILKVFAQASEVADGNVFVQQLQEKLAVILAKQPELAALAAENGLKKEAAKEKDSQMVQPVGTELPASDKTGIAANQRSNKPAVLADDKQIDAPDMTVKVHTPAAVTASGRLEMLAAKSMPVNRPELFTVHTEQASVEAEPASGGSEESALPISFAQELNRLVPQKAALPADAVVRADSLVEDMGQFLIGKLRIQNGHGLTEARLTLNPESLGQVEVKLSMQNGQLVAQFAAHTAMGKDVLESQLSQLRLALQNQGIQVEKLEVTQSPTLQSGMFQEQRHQQPSQQFNRRNQSEHQSEGIEDYAVEAAAILNGRMDPEKEGFDVTA